MNKITGLTLAVLMSMSVFSVSAAPIDTTKPIVKEKTGNFVGVNIKENENITWDNDADIRITSKKDEDEDESGNYVFGMRANPGSVVTMNKNLKMVVKIEQETTKGSSSGADILHYYMAGIYAGNGMGGYAKDKAGPKVQIKGNVDMEVTGSAIQSNQKSQITVEGGGKIIVHPVSKSEVYSLVAEEGNIYINAGVDGKVPGTNKLEITGNMGIINKNYGVSQNPGELPTLISVGFTTKDSVFIGSVLNEFEENGTNPHASGVTLYLQNGATWENQWLGTKRVAAPRKDADSYLYTGSKVMNLIGGESEEKAGIIHQNEDKDITVKNFSGHVKVIYKQNATNAKAFDGGAIRIKTAKENSQITLRSNIKDFQMPQNREVVNYDEALNALAGKLFYDANDGHLKGVVEFAETLDKPAYTKEISFKSDTHQGEYKPKTTPLPAPSVPKEQTETIFKNGRIDGNMKDNSTAGDFEKFGVWNKEKKSYIFTKDSTIETQSITSSGGDAVISAKDKTLTINSTDEYGINAYHGREYKKSGAQPFSNIKLNAKKIILNVDGTKFNEGRDTFGIAAASDKGKSVNITGDVEIHVKNKYAKTVKSGEKANQDILATGIEKNVTFTNGIAAIHQTPVVIQGNVKIDVQAEGLNNEKGDSFTHYFVNGIFAGLNYNRTGFGQFVINGDTDITTNGTGVYAGSRYFVQLNGGVTITTAAHANVSNYSLVSEEGALFLNMKFNEEGEVIGAGDKTVKVYGNIGILNREDKSDFITGMFGSSVNLGLTTPESILEGVVVDEFHEMKNPPADKREAIAGSGLTLYLKNKATWHNKVRGMVAVKNWTGSKVMKVTGGKNFDDAGIIYQEDDKPITIHNYDGYTKVIYTAKENNPAELTGGEIILKSVKRGSEIAIRTSNTKGLNTSASASKEDKAVVDKTLDALAHKLVYEGKDGNLTAYAEIAEGLATPAVSVVIPDYTADGHGEYIKQPIDPAHPPVKPEGKVIKKTEPGAVQAYKIKNNQKYRYDGDLTVEASGSGISSKSDHGNVTGIYLLNGGQLTVGGDLKVVVKNARPAEHGEPKGSEGPASGADTAHYYMSGVYAGYGGENDEGNFNDTVVYVKGNADLDVVGVALQANKDGYITIMGGGKIKTYELKKSETYAMLAEEGSVFMNTGNKGNAPGTSDVDIYGNLGVINKNYGIDPNPDNHGSFVSVGLTTAKSKLVGGVLNEFEEGGVNTNDSGVDIYLQNGATWENRWIGAPRPPAQRRGESEREKYLYKGSKVRNLIGGESEAKAGIIYQNEDKDITVKNFSGHVKVIYKQNATNAKAFDGGAIRIKTAKENSQITLRSNIKDFQMPQNREVVNYDEALNALAGKLFYDANDGHLKGVVEFAETLDKPAYAKEISFKSDTHQGEYKPKTTPPVVPPVTPSAEETKEYTTKSIDGKASLWHNSDSLKKAKVYKGTGQYEFTTNAIVKAKVIDGTSGDVNIKADGKILTFNMTGPIGISSYEKRGYSADDNYPDLSNVTVTAKKIILNVNQADKSGSGVDAFGIAAGSGSGKTVTINGDVQANVTNKYYKDADATGEKEPTFTNGLGVVNNGKIVVNGNVEVNVQVPKQEKLHEPQDGVVTNVEFLNHYFVNGIFTGLNYVNKKPGGEIKITGDVNINTNGTGIHAGARSKITVLGGGIIKSVKHDDFAQFSLNAEEGVINMNVTLDDQDQVTGVGQGTVKIEGNIGLISREESANIDKTFRTAVNLALVNKDSYLTGIIQDDYREHDRDAGKEVSEAVKKVRAATGATLYLQNGATWNNESWGALIASPWRKVHHDFTGSKVKVLIGGENADKAGIINQNDNRDITVDDYSGHVKVIYKQNATNAKAFDGGAIRIKTAKENSQITLRSNIRDFQKPSGENADYDALLNTLAGKLYYEAKDNHLTAQAEIAESLATPAYAKKISFKAADGQGEVKGGTTPGQTPGEGGTTPGQRPGEGGTTPGQTPGEGGTTPGQDPNFETSAMKGIRSAMVSTGMISTGAFWSAQNNDVERRMGDIRLARTETGLWAKYQGGSSEYNDTDSREKAVHVDQTYNAIQVGYDKSVGDWIVGGTFSYGTTKDKYIDNRDTGKLNGTGKETGFNGGVYGTLKQKDGSYFDIIAKVGQIKNNYEVYTKDWDKDKKNDDKVNSEYKVNGTSLSVEYGKRIEREGFYVEPSMELTVNRVVGHSEEVTSEVHKYKMKITQDDMTSVVGRIGVGIGQNYENGHIYGKLSLAHEFNGDIMTTFSAGNKEEVVKLSLRGTWLDVEMGGSYRLSKDSYFYGSFTKNFGAKLNNKWRLDAGIRLAF